MTDLLYSIFPTLPHFRTLILGPAGNSRWGFLFFVSSLLLWGYPVYFYKVRYHQVVVVVVVVVVTITLWIND